MLPHDELPQHVSSDKASEESVYEPSLSHPPTRGGNRPGVDYRE